jgi:uncharacterized repeat protein (TIGR01451 family)
MTDSPDPVQWGDNLSYDIEVENLGPSPASAVILSDTLPGSVSFISASPECSESTGIVTCQLGDLPSGGISHIQILVSADISGTVTNTVEVSSNTSDPQADNNTVQTSTHVDSYVDGDTEIPFLPLWALALLGGSLPLLGLQKARQLW